MSIFGPLKMAFSFFIFLTNFHFTAKSIHSSTQKGYICIVVKFHGCGSKIEYAGIFVVSAIEKIENTVLAATATNHEKSGRKLDTVSTFGSLTLGESFKYVALKLWKKC